MDMPNSRPVVVFGCGGHGRVIADALLRAQEPVAGFLDDDPPAATVDGLPVLGSRECLGRADFLLAHAVIIGVGDAAIRRALSTAVLDRGGALATAVHPAAVIARGVVIGAGTAIMAGAIVNTGSSIGRFAVVNTGATVDHDCVIEDGVHVSPGCHLAGAVVCAADAFIGTGANVIPKIRIGARAVVAAGATVIADVPPGVLVAGRPAVVKRAGRPPT